MALEPSPVGKRLKAIGVPHQGHQIKRIVFSPVRFGSLVTFGLASLALIASSAALILQSSAQTIGSTDRATHRLRFAPLAAPAKTAKPVCRDDRGRVGSTAPADGRRWSAASPPAIGRE